MSFFSLLLSFAPWLILKAVSVLPLADPFTMLRVAFVIGALVCAWQSWHSTVRGFIFWGTAFFFSFSMIFVVFFPNMWIIEHLNVLSQVNLCIITWGSIFFKRPFTLDYAKQHVPQALWTHPRFLRKNYILTGVWGVYFLLGLISSEIRLYEPQVSSALFEVFDNVSMIVAMLVTSHLSKVPSVPASGGEEASSAKAE